jgi:hypothetical protein
MKKSRQRRHGGAQNKPPSLITRAAGKRNRPFGKHDHRAEGKTEREKNAPDDRLIVCARLSQLIARAADSFA